MIWSCCPFFNELDVLELRLRTIGDAVDRHVVVEGTRDHVGRRKRLYLTENLDRFAEWRDRLEVVVVEDMPRGTGHWTRERFQRDACIRGMDDLSDDDLVFLSDLDEIPCPALFRNPPPPVGGPANVPMNMHLYTLNWRWRETPVEWATRACLVTGLMLDDQKPSELVEAPWYAIPGGHGWHLAYMGGVRRIQQKIRSLADFDDPEWRENWRPHWLTTAHLEECIRTGRDLFDRKHRDCEWVGLDQLPPPVQEDPERWAHMMTPEPVAA